MMLRTGLLLAISLSCASADALTGRVFEDHSGTPLASVEVRVAKDGVRELLADVDTDPQGRFDIADLPPGEYRVEFVKSNYLPATVRVKAGASTLAVRLVRSAVVSGHVVDAANIPVSGARILITPKDVPIAFQPQYPYPSTDDQGQYRIRDLPPGQYTVGVMFATPESGLGVRLYPDSAHPRVFEVSGGENIHDIDFVLLKSALYSVSGVVEPRGRSYAIALAPVEQPNVAIANVTRTAMDGAFHFDSIPPGTYTVFASGPSKPYMQGGAMLGDNPAYGRTQIQVIAQNVEIALKTQTGPSIRFTLKPSAPTRAQPCAQSAEMKITPLEAWGAIVERTLPLPVNKEQTLANVAPGRYRMTLSQLGDACFLLGDGVLDAAALNGPVSVEIAPAGAIRGRLTGTTEPASFLIVLSPSDAPAGAASIQFATPDDKGAFRFDELRPGRYRVAVRPAAEASKARWLAELARMAEIDVLGGPPMEMDLPAPVVMK